VDQIKNIVVWTCLICGWQIYSFETLRNEDGDMVETKSERRHAKIIVVETDIKRMLMGRQRKTEKALSEDYPLGWKNHDSSWEEEGVRNGLSCSKYFGPSTFGSSITFILWANSKDKTCIKLIFAYHMKIIIKCNSEAFL